MDCKARRNRGQRGEAAGAFEQFVISFFENPLCPRSQPRSIRHATCIGSPKFEGV
jgi:hypothetical protein